MVPDFLVIGHVVLDRVEGGYRLGGTATYASLTANRLGLRAAVLTSTGPEVNLTEALPGIEVVNVPAPCTTTFVNTYTDRGRVQQLLAVAPPISLDRLPDEWRGALIVLLGPLDQEVDPNVAAAFPGALVGLSPQGWMRRWDVEGHVWHEEWDGGTALDAAHAMALAVEDLPTGKLPDGWHTRPRILAVTEGAKGSRLRYDGQWYSVPAYPAQEVDPTGAGDVYVAALLVRYYETRDPLAAALFASCAASFCVEAPGTAGLPTRNQVLARMAQHPDRRVVPV